MPRASTGTIGTENPAVLDVAPSNNADDPNKAIPEAAVDKDAAGAMEAVVAAGAEGAENH